MESMRTANWREVIRQNSKRTYMVMGTFVLIYALLGLLLDVIACQASTGVSTGTAFKAVLTFAHPPILMGITVIIAIVSLFITYAAHNKLMLMGTDYKEITINGDHTLEEQQLFNIVEEMKIAAGLNYMPRVYIIEANYMNAFASGFSEKSAMVAITRGLLEKLDRDETQAVMAHELSHIRHQDIKLTLTASVLSNIMLIIVDMLFYSMIYGRRRKVDTRLLIIVLVLRYGLPILTGLLMLYLSRKREFMADAGSVELMRSNEPMARALIKIHEDHQTHVAEQSEEYGKTKHEDVRRAAYLYDPVKTGIEPTRSFTSMFSTHPDLYARLESIGYKVKK